MSKKEGIVPLYLLDQLAEKGNEKAKETSKQTREIHDKRVNKFNSRDSTLPNNRAREDVTDRPGQPDRHIYDCENKRQVRKKLVRGEGDPATNDDDVNRAYDFSGIVLKYYTNVLNRDSIDNQGMDLIFNVNYSKNFLNAYWDPDTDEMVFGDGDGSTFLSFTRAIDVVAHEMTHGVTEYINNLKYERQSGALNEHFSDVIGSAIKQHVNGQNANNADWLIGDKIVGPEWDGIALRSMKEPGTAFADDPQPDHMRDYRELPVTREGDYGGVHIYSGIPNKAFHLVSMEIGTDNAAVIWYNAWNDREHLHPNSQFKDAFEAILKAAQTLSSQGRMPQNTVEAVKRAFSEVGIYSLVGV